jgi:hypothetical protein
MGDKLEANEDVPLYCVGSALVALLGHKHQGKSAHELNNRKEHEEADTRRRRGWAVGH